MKPTFEPEPDPAVDALAVEIRARRTAGLVHVEHRRWTGAEASPHSVVSALVESVGMHPCEPWVELTAAEALATAARVLQVDLAYQLELMPTGEARALAQRFLGSCGERAIFVTNGSLALTPNGGAWNPITTATFDTGVIAVSLDRVGMLWVEDED